MSKGGSNTTTVQKSDPWKPAQQSLKDILGQGSQLWPRSLFQPVATRHGFTIARQGDRVEHHPDPVNIAEEPSRSNRRR